VAPVVWWVSRAHAHHPGPQYHRPEHRKGDITVLVSLIILAYRHYNPRLVTRKNLTLVDTLTWVGVSKKLYFVCEKRGVILWHWSTYEWLFRVFVENVRVKKVYLL